MLAANFKFIVQMRASRETGRAHVTDRLALADPCSFTHASSESRKMAVKRAYRSGMADLHDIAVTALDAGKFNYAVEAA